MTGERVRIRTNERIRLGRIRRERQLRRRITLFAVLVVSILVLTVAGGSFISRAQDRNGETFYKYYTSIQIRPGDTLWSLADAYATEQFDSRQEFVREVIRTNHLLDEDIQSGNYLIIPYYSTEFKE